LKSEAIKLREWKAFFGIKLPIALLLFAGVIECASYLLSGVTLHRHNVDDLANAVLHDDHPYKVVLLGDSITHNVAHKYRIGDPDEVAALTTHAFAGLPSSLFLLKRYLESNHRPVHVVIAASREVFTNPIEKGTFNYYVTSVFTWPYERAFLSQHYADNVDYRWKPAALSITTKVGEPLFSLLRRPGDQIWSAPDVPPANPSREQYPGDVADSGVFREKLGAPSTLTPEARAILIEFCSLSRQYRFQLHLIWAPIEPGLRDAMAQEGRLRTIDDQVKSIAAQAQVQMSIDDASDQQAYPFFDRDMIHIKGLGWEQTYALQLSSYIHSFEAQSGKWPTPSSATP
jgi:hypothetical protein